MRRSRTAQYVALTRAVLAERCELDDPYAAEMLDLSMRATLRLLRLPLLGRYKHSPLVSALSARIRFFDDQVVRALDHGLTQVVTVGAGYDSRAWRFARDGVQFFEIDHPGTQTDKRRRAPEGGPTFVPADLATGNLARHLQQAGFAASAPAIFVIEGVTMYLSEHQALRTLEQLASTASPGSRLAVNFAAPPGWGTPRDRIRQQTLRILGRGSGEAHRFFIPIAYAKPFVDSAGWKTIDCRPLTDTSEASLVVAHR